MTRAWAETVWAGAQTDPQTAWEKIYAVFGADPRPAKKAAWIPDEVMLPSECVGRIVFHDAWPLTWPKLERDIINNHHSKYYAEASPPGDWEKPTLVNFLAVAAGTEFDFALSDRAKSGDGLITLAMQWLSDALLHAGAGAKTAAGYGRIEPAGYQRPAPPESKRVSRSVHMLELVSPAFLAGAGQEANDCDLRPATLRGLLRWWWRTMHASHLEAKALLKLESFVWGNTEVGSRITLDLEAGGENNGAAQYDEDAIANQYLRRSSQKAKKKFTQGLYYGKL